MANNSSNIFGQIVNALYKTSLNYEQIKEISDLAIDYGAARRAECGELYEHFEQKCDCAIRTEPRQPIQPEKQESGGCC